MKFEIIDKNNKNKYKVEFIEWMDENHQNIARVNIMYTNIMLSINNNIGFSINDLIFNNITLEQYKQNYIKVFEKRNRKNPKGHASVQVWCAKYFLKFIESKYTI